jgi:metal-responsive CopG/Arc/MetJ family transcriptional regulator
MKTAISVEDELLQEADRTAKTMGVSRSRLFSLAIQDFLRERQQREVLEQLNQVYNGQPDPLAAKMKAKFRTVIQDKW